MQEAEIILRVALYHIMNDLTKETVTASIDGAHIKTREQIHFDIWAFLQQNGCIKTDNDYQRWQGEYEVTGYQPHIIITSQSGIGDVNLRLADGSNLYVECKKGKPGKSGQEYPLMREAIGQLMTGCELTDNMIPVVAVPYSEKSFELAGRWQQYSQIKQVGIRFYLVKDDGTIVIV